MNLVLTGLALFIVYIVFAIIYYWVGCFIQFKIDQEFAHFRTWYYVKRTAPDRECILVQSIAWPLLTFVIWPIILTVYGLIKLVSFPIKAVLGIKIDTKRNEWGTLIDPLHILIKNDVED